MIARVGDGVDDARDARGDEGLGAGAGAAGVVAGLERHDRGRAARRAGGELRQGVDLGVRRAGAAVPALGEDVAVGESSTAPTCGFTPRGPLSASASARRMALVLRVCAPSSVFLAWLSRLRGKGERRRAPRRPCASHPDYAAQCALHHRRFRNSTGSASASLPEGMQEPRLADCHRRFGFSPTPEHVDALSVVNAPAGDSFHVVVRHVAPDAARRSPGVASRTPLCGTWDMPAGPAPVSSAGRSLEKEERSWVTGDPASNRWRRVRTPTC